MDETLAFSLTILIILIVSVWFMYTGARENYAPRNFYDRDNDDPSIRHDLYDDDKFKFTGGDGINNPLDPHFNDEQSNTQIFFSS